MKNIITVMLKEIIENWRDRKTMASSMLMGALLGPVIFIVMINFAVKANSKEAHSILNLPIQNQEYAEGLIQFLKRQSVNVETVEGDPKILIEEKSNDVILVIDKSFSEQFKKGSPAKIQFFYNAATKGVGHVKIERVRNLINQYSSMIGTIRLQLRGVHPQIMQAVFIENHDISTSETRAASFLSFLPFFLMMGIFVGGMYLAIDSTAGEKERGSLEPLLINPAKRSELLLGKLAATFSFSVLNLVLSVIGFKICMYFLPEKEMGFEITLQLTTLIMLIFVLLPVCLLASAVQIIIGTFSKGFREAQTYTGLLTLVPMLPVMVVMMTSIKEKLWMMSVPILSQNLLIEKFLGNQEVSWSYIGLSITSTLAIGVVCAFIAIKLYQREVLLFSE